MFEVEIAGHEKLRRPTIPLLARHLPRERKRKYLLHSVRSRRKLHLSPGKSTNHPQTNEEKTFCLSRYICEGYYVLISDGAGVKNSRSRKNNLFRVEKRKFCYCWITRKIIPVVNSAVSGLRCFMTDRRLFLFSGSFYAKSRGNFNLQPLEYISSLFMSL